jgi:hypothetical protein
MGKLQLEGFDGTNYLPVKTDITGNLTPSGLRENYFHTSVTYNATQSAAAIIAGTTATQLIITDVYFSSNTQTSITLLEDNTAAAELFSAQANSFTPLCFSPNTPLAVATAVGVDITTDSTVTSVYIAGFKI